MDHDQALAWREQWTGVDVLVLDAADEARSGDQFPGVAVVRAVRDAVPAGGPLVIVVTGHYLHDGLRHRMAAAGADFYYLRADLRRADELLDVVLHPERHRRGVPAVRDRAGAQAVGVSATTDVEAVVGWIEAEGIGPDIDPDAPIGRADPRSRRWLRARRAAAGAGGLKPVNMTTGDAPQGHDVPSIRQLGRLWSWAARVKRRDD